MEPAFELVVNGRTYRVHAAPDTSLLEVLRDDLGLSGTKYGCGESRCGACTVLLDHEPVHSCATTLDDIKGRHVTTIEGLEKDGKLHPVQQAFLEEGAMQCGYCVPGMIMAAVGHFYKHTSLNDAQIAKMMDSNVCRCGGYPRMVAAIKKAAGSMR
jgi:aerobic-type carbon monoxide dehydrogenase small subunit (CoxS/CutS family)